jgi:hypothetical protein
MAEKKMKLPTTPQGWANHLSLLVKAFHNAHGLDRFPIKVAAIAKEYSRNVFPDAPITKVEGLDLSAKFEGMLMPHPDKNGEWGIVYNKSITSKGRINFTLAHELCHYLLHRQISPAGIRCSPRDMLDWKSELGQIEAQANTFASFLLMPLDDFREQVRGKSITMDLMEHLSDRYEVSITAAILKWLEITDKRAMIVVGKDGFIDWAWSSDRLFKSRIFYAARQQTIELPAQSLAALRIDEEKAKAGVVHKKGIWRGDEDVHEMTVFAPRYEMTISLLVYPNGPPLRQSNYDAKEPEELDTYDQFVRQQEG